MSAVQTFNNPLTTFKAETFIVLMNIAWLYLLHAYYRRERIEYRYNKQGPKRRKFDRTKSGAFKYWELRQCLYDRACPLDNATKQNLLFLIGLRDEIEHHQSVGADETLASRYLACCLNYERYICELFGQKRSLGDSASFTLQFRNLDAPEIPIEAAAPLPSNVAKYVQEFDANLSDDDFSSPHYRRRFLFVPLLTNKRGQADRVIQFVPAGSEIAKSINSSFEIFIKEVERPKYLPSKVVEIMQEAGYTNFKMFHHIQLWKALDGKNPAKGFGVEIGNIWYWYERWVDEVRKRCVANAERYGRAP